MTPRRLACEMFPTHDAAIDRVVILETELEQAAEILQTIHPIGKVKAIGLLAVAIALRDIAEELQCLRKRLGRRSYPPIKSP